jgi:tetratricopeptide (TPR) repeat protein
MAVFSPGRLNDDEIFSCFIARQSQLNLILEDIRNTRPKSIPQHHLVIGQRGMGKTTLLMRLQVAMRRKPLVDQFIPLGFPEEQYSVDRLSALFLNCLDSIADTLEKEEGSQDLLDRIDNTVTELRSEAAADELVAQDAEHALMAYAAETGRRPVLLMDNLNLVFNRLNKPELHQLRAFLMKNSAPILIGAAVHPPEDDYEAPFYDHFKPHFLSRLSLEEMQDVLLKLAEQSGNKEILDRLSSEQGRLHALHSLTGGNPRTTRILFEIFAHGFSQEAYQDLEALLDWMTPIYKARFEELSDQAQVVVSAIATIWEPAVQKTICAVTRLKPNQVSPQLDRLKKAGIIEEITVDPPNRNGPIPDRRTPKDRKGYQLAERFFNIWFLMRQATRRDKRNLIHLTRFIECWFSPEERTKLAEDILIKQELTKAERAYGLALEQSIQQQSLRLRLHDHLLGEFIRAKKVHLEQIEELIDPEEIPPQRWAIAEIREKLCNAVPASSGIDANEFADMILRSPQFVSVREEIASTPLTDEKAQELMAEANKQLANLVSVFGESTGMWLTSLFKEGILTNLRNIDQLEAAIFRADSQDKLESCLMLATIKQSSEYLSDKAFTVTANFLRPEESSTDASKWFDWAEKCIFLFGNKSEAIAVSKRVLELDANHAGAARMIAQFIDENTHTDEEILEAYNNAVSLNPNSAYLLTKLGTILYEKFGRLNEAEIVFRKSLKTKPDYDWTWLQLSHLQSEYLGDLNSAEKSLRHAVELQPDNSFYWFRLADILSTMPGKETETENAFKEAINLSPEDEYMILSLGSFLSKQSTRRKEALALLKEAVELQPDSILARTQLASLLESNEETYDDAIDQWLEVVKRDPNNTMARLSIAIWMKKSGDDEKFYDVLQTAIKTANRWMLLRMTRTFGCFSGRPDLGKKIFESLRALTPEENLHELLFDEIILDAAEDNWGKASKVLSCLISRLGERMAFPKEDKDSWLDMSAALLFYNHGEKFIVTLAQTGAEQSLRPWAEAVRAHVRGDRKYLRNAPAEVRESAGKLFDEITIRLQRLSQTA